MDCYEHLSWKLQRSRALWHCPLLCRWKAVSACALFRVAKWALLLNFEPVRGRRSNMMFVRVSDLFVLFTYSRAEGVWETGGVANHSDAPEHSVSLTLLHSYCGDFSSLKGHWHVEISPKIFLKAKSRFVCYTHLWVSLPTLFSHIFLSDDVFLSILTVRNYMQIKETCCLFFLVVENWWDKIILAVTRGDRRK